MTREQLAAVKSAAERAQVIIADIEALEAAREQDLSHFAKTAIDARETPMLAIGNVLLTRVLKIGIDTLKEQLESELASVPVTGVEVKPNADQERLQEVQRGVKWPVVHPRGEPRFRNDAARGELAEMAGETCFTIPAKLSEVGT